jgi:hypothetical protein
MPAVTLLGSKERYLIRHTIVLLQLYQLVKIVHNNTFKLIAV